MRAFEFYQQRLKESAASSPSMKEISANLNQVEQNVQQNPEKAQTAIDGLNAMIAAADKMLAAIEKNKQTAAQPIKKPVAKPVAPAPKPTGVVDPNPAPPVESLDENLVEASDEVVAQLNQKLQEKIQQIMLATSDMSKVSALVAKATEEHSAELVEATKEEQFKQRQQYAFEEGNAVALLAGKVVGSLDAIQDHYIHKIAQRKAMMNEQDKTVAEYEKSLARSKPKISTIEEEIKTLLIGTMEHFRRGADSSKAEAQFNKKSLEFLNACKVGVIGLADLLSKGSGNFIDEIPKKYAWVRESGLADRLLAMKPSGSGAGSWGPGELGLSILGKPVNKSGKGDLEVDGKKFELKASAKATSGGRVNTEAVMVGKDGRVDFESAWDEFSAKLAPGSIVLNGEKIAFANLEDKPKNIRSKNITRTSIGPTWIAIVNAALRHPENKVSAGELQSFLIKVLTAPISPAYKSKVKYNGANLVTNVDGAVQINGTGLLQEYLKQTLLFYNQTDGVEDILVVNPSDGHFEVVNATDSKGLNEKISSGAIQTSTTWIDFKDPQSKAGPQLGTASPK
jgi:hypothetical protein